MTRRPPAQTGDARTPSRDPRAAPTGPQRLTRHEATLRALAARIDAGDAGAHNNLGVVLFRKGLVDDAVAAFERALELDERFDVARRNAMVALTENGYASHQVRRLRAALEDDPDDGAARDALARLYLLIGDPDSAAFEWRWLLERQPDSVPLNLKLAYAEGERGRTAVAIHLLRTATELPPALGEVRLQLAERLHELGDNARAEAEVRQALSMDEDNARAHAFLGVVLSALGREEEAEAARERAGEIAPGIFRADDHLTLERWLDAWADQAGRELASDSDEGSAGPPADDDATSPRVWNDRGVALHRASRPDDAILCFRRALALDRGYLLGWNNLGVALAGIGDERAAERALRAATADDAPPEVLWNLGLFLSGTGRPGEAVETYRRGVEAEEDLAESWGRLGAALLQAERPEAARDALSEALTRDPLLVEARHHLGFALYLLGDFRGSLRETREALKEAHLVPSPRYRLLVDAQFEHAESVLQPLDMGATAGAEPATTADSRDDPSSPASPTEISPLLGRGFADGRQDLSVYEPNPEELDALSGLTLVPEEEMPTPPDDPDEAGEPGFPDED